MKLNVNLYAEDALIWFCILLIPIQTLPTNTLSSHTDFSATLHYDIRTSRVINQQKYIVLKCCHNIQVCLKDINMSICSPSFRQSDVFIFEPQKTSETWHPTKNWTGFSPVTLWGLLIFLTRIYPSTCILDLT